MICGFVMVVDKIQIIVFDLLSVVIVFLEYFVLEVLDVEVKKVFMDVVDLVQFFIFGYRFMSVVEQMGQIM